MRHVVVDLEEETIGKRGADSAGTEVRRTAGDVFVPRHFVVELDRGCGRILFVIRKAHGDAHEEILRRLQRMLIHVLDRIAIQETVEPGVYEELIAFDRKRIGELLEVVERHVGVQTALGDAVLYIERERITVLLFEICGVVEVVIANNAAIDGLQEESRCDFVIFDVLFDVLDSGIDGRFIHFLGGDPVIERELSLCGDLGHHRNRIEEPGARALDRTVDLIRIEGLFFSVALRY